MFRGRFCWVTLLLACSLLVSGSALAESRDGVQGATVVLGDSLMPLVGPWRFTPGDSPEMEGKLLWAQPGFDDSQWSAVSLAEPAGKNGTLPGWTGRGFPEVDRGYGWYRLTVRVGSTRAPLSLKMPSLFDDAFQVYANGKLAGSFGFRGGAPVAYYSRPTSYALPPPDSQGLLTIALRFWLDPNTRFETAGAGGLHAAPVIGYASTIGAMQRRDDSASVLYQVIGGGVLPGFFLLAALTSLWAWIRVRREKAYLWLAIRLLVNVLDALVYDLALAGLVTQNSAIVVEGILIRSFLAPGWIVFWWYWFGLQRERWIAYAAAALVVLGAGNSTLARATAHGLLPAGWAVAFLRLNTAVELGAVVLLLVVFAKGYRRNRAEALLAVVPVVLNEIDVVNGFAFRTMAGWDATVLGIHVYPAAAASLILVLLIGALAIRRFLALHARQMLAQQTLEAELTQASELQKRVLLPETSTVPFAALETAYLPSQAMGGDFFQILTNASGATLVVVGDVSGKGIAAAFLVAVLVGALRTRAEESLDPNEMLQLLNARMLDRSEGHFATCLAVLLEEDGACEIVNAGHLSPYLNGEEVRLEGTLPLGLVAEPELSTVRLRLRPKDRLTLLTDGVVEAMDAGGNLFGFERTQAASKQGAAEIARRAMVHGQEDDITVVSLTYAGIQDEDAALVA